jgi:hypothetical protein
VANGSLAGEKNGDAATVMATRWIRWIMQLDRAVEWGSRAARSLLMELPCLLVPPTRLEEVTAWVYSREKRYLPGTDFFQQGLFAWELELLRTAPFPREGRLLLGGAGGGRELVALSSLGYRVVAFEPSALVEAVRDVAHRCPAAQAHTASYGDIIRLVRGEGTVLARVFDEPFHGIVLGWGSLSHVLDPAERHCLFPALRTLAPSAPIVCSFLVLGEPRSRSRGRWLRLRLRGRRVDPNLRFWPHIGFVHLFTRGEITTLAGSAGYEVARYEEEPYPHALLVPLTDQDRDCSAAATRLAQADRRRAPISRGEIDLGPIGRSSSTARRRSG